MLKQHRKLKTFDKTAKINTEERTSKFLYWTEISNNVNVCFSVDSGTLGKQTRTPGCAQQLVLAINHLPGCAQNSALFSDACTWRHNGEQTDKTTRERAACRCAPECNFLADDRSTVRRSNTAYQQHACRRRRLTTVTRNKLVISFAQQRCKLCGRRLARRTPQCS